VSPTQRQMWARRTVALATSPVLTAKSKSNWKELVCCSPEGDLVGGLVVTAIGIDACRRTGRFDHRLLAAFPLLLGTYQLAETFVWCGLQGVVPLSVGLAAMWIYLVVAFVVLPILVPLIIMLLTDAEEEMEDRALRGRRPGRLSRAAGGDTADRSHRPPGAYHLSYTIGLHHGIAIIGLYIVATCGSLLASGFRDIASLWCCYAALASGAIVLHMCYATSHRHTELAV
jgi:hypothetical protein